MAKSSNDFKPIEFEREVNGTTFRRTANTPSDEVQLRFDGWRPATKTTAKSSSSGSGGSSTTSSKS